jgi:LEA14-like dessication related protein
MKHKGILIALGVISIIMVCTWWRHSSPGEDSPVKLAPELSLATVNIRNIDEHKIDLSAGMIINNRLPINLKTNKVRYKLSINGRKVMESALNKEIEIRSQDSTRIDIPMQLLVHRLTKVLDQIKREKADSADYRLDAMVFLDIPIKGMTSFNFTVTKRLPSIRLPKIEMKDVDIEKFALKKSTLQMMITINNPNDYPFKMKDIDYDLNMGKDLVMSGQVTGVTNIPGNSKKDVPVELKVKNGKMIKLLGKTLFDTDEKILLDFKCKLISNTEFLNNSAMAMKTETTPAELKKGIKNIKRASKDD